MKKQTVTKKPYAIGMVNLGCPKNQVDAEQMLGVLSASGYEITADQHEADLIVVNTCGFIEAAKEESIAAILDVTRMKEEGRCKKVVIAGCLAQRYKEELLKELPEADAVIGTAEIGRIGEICGRVLRQTDRVLEVSDPALVYGLARVSTTPRHYRYLKIAEGCGNRCSYCAIPIIRGGFKSRPCASILDEARRLVDDGAKELILLAQDSTAYRDGDVDLPALLAKLTKIPELAWVRLMYAYPGRVSDKLMSVMAAEEKICPYLDIPIQHFDDTLLKTMNRRGASDDIRKTIDLLRKRVPGIALRTSLIVGFPGETEAAFKRLLSYVKEAEFEHLGAFTYSPEEGTAAYDFASRVPAEIAAERLDRIMRAQARISLKKNKALVGLQRRVLIDDLEDMALIGRLQTQAPEIDGVVYLSETEALPGEFVDVTITDATAYDLMGKAPEGDAGGMRPKRQAPRSRGHRRGKQIPVLAVEQ